MKKVRRPSFDLQIFIAHIKFCGIDELHRHPVAIRKMRLGDTKDL
jgi:hypothetical protein